MTTACLTSSTISTENIRLATRNDAWNQRSLTSVFPASFWSHFSQHYQCQNIHVHQLLTWIAAPSLQPAYTSITASLRVIDYHSTPCDPTPLPSIRPTLPLPRLAAISRG